MRKKNPRCGSFINLFYSFFKEPICFAKLSSPTLIKGKKDFSAPSLRWSLAWYQSKDMQGRRTMNWQLLNCNTKILNKIQPKMLLQHVIYFTYFNKVKSADEMQGWLGICRLIIITKQRICINQVIRKYEVISYRRCVW